MHLRSLASICSVKTFGEELPQAQTYRCAVTANFRPKLLETDTTRLLIWD